MLVFLIYNKLSEDWYSLLALSYEHLSRYWNTPENRFWIYQTLRHCGLPYLLNTSFYRGDMMIFTLRDSQYCTNLNQLNGVRFGNPTNLQNSLNRLFTCSGEDLFISFPSMNLVNHSIISRTILNSEKSRWILSIGRVQLVHSYVTFSLVTPETNAHCLKCYSISFSPK